MLKFQPSGFKQESVQTRLGSMVYYRPEVVVAADKPLVFFHNFGGGASAFEWSQVYAFFSRTHRILAPDLIGWGNSAHPERRYSVQDYLDTIEDFLREVSEEPVIAIASSFTGALIARLAATKPDLFEKLFLVCPAGFRDFGTGAGRRLPEPIINTPFLDKAIYTLGATNEIAVRNFLENFLYEKRDRLSPETVNAYLASANKPNAEYAALSFLRGDLYFDLAPYWVQIQKPTALVWGEKAKFTPVSTGERLAALNPNAVEQLQVVSDTGVLPHLEQPGTVAALLLQFLSKPTD